MPEISIEFKSVKFPPDIVRAAREKFISFTGYKLPFFYNLQISRRVSYAERSLEFDSDEEFYKGYAEEIESADFDLIIGKFIHTLVFRLHYFLGDTRVSIRLPYTREVEEVLKIFEEGASEYVVEVDNIETERKPAHVTKGKKYSFVKLPAELVKKAYSVFLEVRCERPLGFESRSWSIEKGYENWEFNNEEEFWAVYREEIDEGEFIYLNSEDDIFHFWYTEGNTHLKVSLLSRQEIERVFEVFEEGYPEYRLPEEKAREAIKDRVIIFIGHGRNPLWKELKDHLSDQHGFKIEAYETGPRAGFHIIEVLKEMSDESSFALLVHTGEDEGANGKLHARDNVIHETGLFQGKLGFNKAIVLLEEGCEEFSNINGLQQIRFTKDNIKETFGDVLATINREFGVD